MDFIIQEEIIINVKTPAVFAQNIEDNIKIEVTERYCNKFIYNRFYTRVYELVSYSDIFIQSNNTGFGSITCIIKFLCKVYKIGYLLFNLNIFNTKFIKSNYINKCDSPVYKNIGCIIPSAEKFDNDKITCCEIYSINIGKASQDWVVANVVPVIYPIILPYEYKEDITNMLKNSESNNKFIEMLNDNEEFSKLFHKSVEHVEKKDNVLIYERGELYEAEEPASYFKDLRNIKDKLLCFDTLEHIIYNFTFYN